MSANPPEPTAPAAPPEGAIRCARCGAEVPPDADWCLECGLAARTRIAPTPRWKIPVAIAFTLIALAIAGLAVAFVDLTKDPEPAATTTAAPTVPPTAPPTTPPAVTTPPPVTVPTTPATTPTAPATIPTTPQTVPTSPGGAVAPPETTPTTATVPPPVDG